MDANTREIWTEKLVANATSKVLKVYESRLTNLKEITSYYVEQFKNEYGKITVDENFTPTAPELLDKIDKYTNEIYNGLRLDQTFTFNNINAVTFDIAEALGDKYLDIVRNDLSERNGFLADLLDVTNKNNTQEKIREIWTEKIVLNAAREVVDNEYNYVQSQDFVSDDLYERGEKIYNRVSVDENFVPTASELLGKIDKYTDRLYNGLNLEYYGGGKEVLTLEITKALGDKYLDIVRNDLSERSEFLAKLLHVNNQENTPQKTQEQNTTEKAKLITPQQNSNSVELAIDKKYLPNIYYNRYQVRFPEESQLNKFAFYVPTDKVKIENDTATFTVQGEVLAKSKTEQATLKPLQIKDIFDGKEIENVNISKIDEKEVLRKRMQHLKNAIPKEMQDKNNWVCYITKWNNEKNKKDKTLVSPVTGKWAKSDDPSTWADFNTAVQYVIDNGYDGVAFALDGGDVNCIDLDHAITNGEVSDLAQKCLDMFPDTYTETSVSGNGLHIFVKGDILGGETFKNRATTVHGEELEVYNKRRFMAISGNNRSKVNTIAECKGESRMFLRNILGKRIVFENRDYSPSRNHLSDDQVIDKIRRSKKGNEFDNLYNGVGLCGDHSRDDFKMFNMLAFFTDCNPEQMRSIFQKSALYRPEKGEKYLDISISNAITSLVARQTKTFNTSPKPQVNENQTRMDFRE